MLQDTQGEARTFSPRKILDLAMLVIMTNSLVHFKIKDEVNTKLTKEQNLKKKKNEKKMNLSNQETKHLLTLKLPKRTYMKSQ